ncbi:AAA family ATPase [Curtobacterium sp. UCD-KPL2560]|uniref:AAA family ATPase n=1 Tax=Curtobacterium sp. UCD-KPL2560 TaxID=1885315 RepID=UPI000826EE83|nr:AAA family ATPase [Curtobacterium sp. UCD-KPL2560]
MELDDLGPRICILGPSNSGKSTLAAAIGRARSLPVVHLDQYRHLPGTQWVERPDGEFARMHAEVLGTERWVIDGNYSRWLPERLQRATGLVLLDASTAASVVRYVRRTLFEPDRAGSLEGTRDRLRVQMIRFLLGPTRKNRIQYRRAFDEFDRPKVLLPDRAALETFARRNDLVRHDR